MAFGNQGFAQGPVIVDFTVENERRQSHPRSHRLCAAGIYREWPSDDGRETRTVGIEIEAFAVRAAVGERICHADNVGTTAFADKARDARTLSGCR